METTAHHVPLGLGIAKKRSHLYTHDPKIGVAYVLGALGLGYFSIPGC